MTESKAATPDVILIHYFTHRLAKQLVVPFLGDIWEVGLTGSQRYHAVLGGRRGKRGWEDIHFVLKEKGMSLNYSKLFHHKNRSLTWDLGLTALLKLESLTKQSAKAGIELNIQNYPLLCNIPFWSVLFQVENNMTECSIRISLIRRWLGQNPWARLKPFSLVWQYSKISKFLVSFNPFKPPC